MNLPGFQLKTIIDGIPKDRPQTTDSFRELLTSLASVTPPLLEDMLTDPKSPVNCIISDGFMSFAIDVAKQVGIPIIYFRTVSACAIWANFASLKSSMAGSSLSKVLCPCFALQF